MTSVRELFAGVDLVPAGRVRWGSKVPVNEPGVYAVATTNDPEDASGLAACPLDGAALRRLLLACPRALIDSVQATEASLAARLSAMWVTGEPVVYIGLASASLTTRVGQYYRTAIGASGPHAGGWPVKMLTLDQLWVHFASCPDPESAEQQLVATTGSAKATRDRRSQDSRQYSARCSTDATRSPCSPESVESATRPRPARSKHADHHACRYKERQDSSAITNQAGVLPRQRKGRRRSARRDCHPVSMGPRIQP
jgi:hypothetical protein